MTKQEIFNKVWNHFITNKGKRSVGSMGQCQYRGDNGLKCAVGILMPEYTYDAEMEMVAIRKSSSHKYFDNFLNYVGNTNIGLLSDLQGIHDNITNWSVGLLDYRVLEAVAEKHCLKTPKEIKCPVINYHNTITDLLHQY